jgi:hypothetical protein
MERDPLVMCASLPLGSLASRQLGWVVTLSRQVLPTQLICRAGRWHLGTPPPPGPGTEDRGPGKP